MKRRHFIREYDAKDLPAAGDVLIACRTLYARRRYPRNCVRLIVLAMLTSCGLRRRELAGLNMRDVDPDSGLFAGVQVRRSVAKGKKPREVPLNWCGLEVLQYIQAWHRMRLRMGARPGDPFICSLDPAREGNRLRPAQIRVYAIGAMRFGGVKRWQRFTTHTLRHFFATYSLHNAAIGIQQVRSAMGHASLATTSRYSHSIPEQVVRTNIFEPAGESVADQQELVHG
jgi:integrase